MSSWSSIQAGDSTAGDAALPDHPGGGRQRAGLPPPTAPPIAHATGDRTSARRAGPAALVPRRPPRAAGRAACEGMGTQLLREVLTGLDADDVPAYLESANQRNLLRYGRNGFSQANCRPWDTGLPSGGCGANPSLAAEGTWPLDESRMQPINEPAPATSPAPISLVSAPWSLPSRPSACLISTVLLPERCEAGRQPTDQIRHITAKYRSVWVRMAVNFGCVYARGNRRARAVPPCVTGLPGHRRFRAAGSLSRPKAPPSRRFSSRAAGPWMCSSVRRSYLATAA
jgi:hypothetical protein